MFLSLSLRSQRRRNDEFARTEQMRNPPTRYTRRQRRRNRSCTRHKQPLEPVPTHWRARTVRRWSSAAGMATAVLVRGAGRLWGITSAGNRFGGAVVSGGHSWTDNHFVGFFVYFFLSIPLGRHSWVPTNNNVAMLHGPSNAPLKYIPQNTVVVAPKSNRSSSR